MINPKELFGNEYVYFFEVDPFNPQNEVAGFISRKSKEYLTCLNCARQYTLDLKPIRKERIKW